MNRIGTKIRFLRNKENIKQRELAERLSVANSTISNWENGHRLPSLSELRRLADYFDVSLSYFDMDHDVTDHSQEVVERLQSDQIIDYRPLDFVPRKQRITLFLISVLIILASKFIVNVVSFVFLFIGIFGMIWVVVFYLIDRDQHKNIISKRVIIPKDHQVIYVHPEDERSIRSLHNQIRFLSLFLVFATIAAYAMAIMHIENNTKTRWGIFIALYSFIVIALATFRYGRVRQKKTFCKRMNYYESFQNNRFYIPLLALIGDLIGYIGIIALAVTFSDLIPKSFTLDLVAVLLCMNVLLSSFIYHRHKRFVSDFDLYTEDTKEKMNRLV